MERFYFTACIIVCAVVLLTGCESLSKQRTATPQQPSNPFAVDPSGIVPPPPTGSVAPNTSFVPPSGASAFSPINNTNTPATTANNTATNTAATVYGSLTPSASQPVSPTPATAYNNTVGDTLLPSVARSATAQQGVASRLHDTSAAISSSVQTTSVAP